MKTLSGDCLWTDIFSRVLMLRVLFIGLLINLREAHLKYTELRIVEFITGSLFINGIRIGNLIKVKLLPNTECGGSDYGKSFLPGPLLLPDKDLQQSFLLLLTLTIEMMLRLYLLLNILLIELKDGLEINLLLPNSELIKF